jgi:hypothetical protein
MEMILGLFMMFFATIGIIGTGKKLIRSFSIGGGSDSDDVKSRIAAAAERLAGH